MHFASSLAGLALIAQLASASVYITNPISDSSFKGGASFTIEWQAVSCLTCSDSVFMGIGAFLPFSRRAVPTAPARAGRGEACCATVEPPPPPPVRGWGDPRDDHGKGTDKRGLTMRLTVRCCFVLGWLATGQGLCHAAGQVVRILDDRTVHRLGDAPAAPQAVRHRHQPRHHHVPQGLDPCQYRARLEQLVSPTKPAASLVSRGTAAACWESAR